MWLSILLWGGGGVWSGCWLARCCCQDRGAARDLHTINMYHSLPYALIDRPSLSLSPLSFSLSLSLPLSLSPFLSPSLSLPLSYLTVITMGGEKGYSGKSFLPKTESVEESKGFFFLLPLGLSQRLQPSVLIKRRRHQLMGLYLILYSWRSLIALGLERERERKGPSESR